jgi:hypothetical protein
MSQDQLAASQDHLAACQNKMADCQNKLVASQALKRDMSARQKQLRHKISTIKVVQRKFNKK